MAGTSSSLNNLDLDSFSFRWDLGLDCEDGDESVSDYGTVLQTGGTDLSAPLTTATGLSAVEEITEGALTDSRTTSTGYRPSLSTPPSDNELGLLPYHDHMDFEATKANKNILDRLRGAMVGNKLVSRLSIPWASLSPTPLAVKDQLDSVEKPSAILYPRPRNKLRKKTRPSIAITLSVEPASSFSLAQPQDTPQLFPRSLEILQTGANPVTVSPVAGFSSTMSFLSFQLPPVFSRARSKVFQKSTRRPPNDMGVMHETSNADLPDVGFSGFRTGKSGDRVSRGSQQRVENSEGTVSVDDNGIGGFPTPIRSISSHDQSGCSGEGLPADGRPGRMSTSWELGLGLGQDLGLRFYRFCHLRGG